LDNFLLSVWAWRVLCFDTESNQKVLRYKVDPNKGELGRTPVIFGNPAGQVLVFHDARQTPLELVKICADFSYIKLQSGVENDVEMLRNNGFKFIRNLVDVQTLITLVRPKELACGIEACTQYVWGDKKQKDKKLRVKWTEFFNRDYERENLTDLALKHSIQDVLTPFAIVVKVALEVAGYRGLLEDPTENMFHIVNEALELCISKAPADIRNTKHDFLVRAEDKGVLANWINDGCVEWDTPFHFNSHCLVHRIRRARANLIEFYHPGISWPESVKLARVHFELLDKRMPTSSELNKLDLRYHLLDHCSFCGSLKHESLACPETTTPCAYEHGPDVVLLPHSIVCCPALHSFCNKCWIRGHLAEVHGKGWKSAAELRRNFLENMPFGLFTSLPYLIRDEELQSEVLPHHFRLGLNGKRLVQSFGDYWLYGGLGKIDKKEFTDGKEHRQTTARNLRATPSTYESLSIVSEEVKLQNAARAIMVERGININVGKKMSGAQRKRRREIEQELRAEAEKSKLS
jgi:hypothetical protein